jgi:hypothetical protein
MSPVTVTVPLLHPVPVQAEKVEPAAAVAVRAIWVPLLTVCVQSLPQLIPVPVTVPLPLPALATVRVKEARLKVAVQVMLPLTVTVPLLHPVPVQPAKLEPLAATAVSTTCVPLLTLWVQSLPQLIPVAVTVPVPLPALATVKVKETELNVAVHVVSAVTVTVPLLHPVPVQPAKLEPLAATAASTTCVPLLTLSLQSLPQLMPLAVTVPLPVPALVTLNKKLAAGDTVVAHCSLE